MKLTSILRRATDDPVLSSVIRQLPNRPLLVFAVAKALCQSVLFRVRLILPQIFFPRSKVGFSAHRQRTRILAKAQSLGTVDIAPASFLELPAKTSSRASVPFTNPPVIRLASRLLSFDDAVYTTPFEDREDRMATHRFVWLLILMQQYNSDDCSKFGRGQIEQWCDRFGHTRNDDIFESYSICERLVSWLHFFMVSGGGNAIDGSLAHKLAATFGAQLSLLAQNLEYHRDLTNNHILNNARGLYICGSFLGNAAIAELGRDILFSEADRFIMTGVLQEDSSHYQMLLTKSFLEIYHAAIFAVDHDTLHWIRPRLKEMLTTCNLLHSRNSTHYPLFGDISPDFDPDWVCGHPFQSGQNSHSGWYCLLGIDLDDLSNAAHVDKTVQVYDHDIERNALRWHYIGNTCFEVWMAGKSGYACHGHNDNGSVLISCHGKPLVVDLGRRNYLSQDPVATFQTSCHAHNTPLLDGIPPDFGHSSLYHGSLPSRSELVCFGENGLDCRLSYLGGIALLHRSVCILPESMAIEDSLPELVKPADYLVHWYLAAELVATRNKTRLSCEISLTNGVTLAIMSTVAIEVHCSRDASMTSRYGILEEVTAIRIRGILESSDKITYSFRVSDGR